MSRASHICLTVLALALFIQLKAQAQPGVFQPGDYRDGVYDKENSVNRRFIPYTHLREADVTWERRVWRTIDIREKINQSFYYPLEPVVSRTSFMQMLLKQILAGNIYAFTDEDFTIPLEKAAIRDKMVIRGDSVDQEQYDANGNAFTVKMPGPVDSTWLYYNFQTLDLKEDWFFDKQKSVLEVRIIGIGINALKKGKEDLGPVNICWLYFPACRPIFAKTEVFNVKNDSERRTWDDMFWKRMFSSTVIKESNVYDRAIETYSKGIDALLESDRIKGDIFRWEHDLWHF
jgi:gliding motility associated protien GldN